MSKKSQKITDNDEFDNLAASIAASDKPVQWLPPSVPVKPNAAKIAQRIRQVAFLKALKECGIIKLACQAAGINRNTEQTWRNNHDAWYDREFKNAIMDHRDYIESTVQDRAINGVKKPIIGRVAKQVGKDIDGNPIFITVDGQLKDDDGKPIFRTDYSDLVLMFHAKKVIPEYKERPVPQPADNGDNAETAMARIIIKLEMLNPNPVAGEIIDVTPLQLPEETLTKTP